MIKNTKIICTLGPSTFNKEILRKIYSRGIDFFRINMSHTPIEDLEEKIIKLKEWNLPIMIDTEGGQIRTGNNEEISLSEGDLIKIWRKPVDCKKDSIFLTPLNIIENLQVGDLLHLDFNSSLIRISSIETLEKGFVEGVVLIGGKVGSKKGVHLDSKIELPAFSRKDLEAIRLAKENNIRDFTLSFVNSAEDVLEFKRLYPEANFTPKIETKKALENLDSILDLSENILIDRGDLSRYVPVEKMPFIQEKIIKKANEKGVCAFVASNTLEKMFESLKPNPSESSDIVNILANGAGGIALTKETAVGEYPVETVNMLSTIINEFNNRKLDPSEDFQNLESPSLVPPHGGKLVNKVLEKIPSEDERKDMKKIYITEENLMDLEQIAVGSFSPLTGFLGKEDLISVLDNYRLKSGVVWPLPIVLQLKTIGNLERGDDVLLIFEEDKKDYGILKLDEIYSLDKKDVSKKWFGTDNPEHPGVRHFLEQGDYFLSGEIFLFRRRNSESKLHELSPKQVRKIFLEKGWSKVVGFHTRNVIHKSHEFIQMKALEKGLCDGLFVHPVIGKKKKGDFHTKSILSTYEKMMEGLYPTKNVIFSALATFSRYSGPREAIFTALVRKNFGCSHFIVGRDHTGVGNFYAPEDSHKIFEKFSIEDLGIEPLKFGVVFFSEIENKYLHENEFPEHPPEKKKHISGTEAREMLKRGESPPEWFMRPEISKILLDKINNSEEVFVE